MRVDVYKVRIYDAVIDDFRVSRRMATKVGAEIMRGEIIPESRVLIDAGQLERGEQWTVRDFQPES